jgi:hypothetical protein
MAFGKRSAGDTNRPSPDAAEAIASESTAPISVRTRVANHGDIDRKFIGVAIGVVVLSAGGAIAAPSLFGAFTGGIRPIEQVIAGLDRSGMEQALAVEAFPDGSGNAFMTSLAANFPEEHGRLLDRLTDAAAAGGDRDDLFAAMNAWSMDFVVKQLPAVSRSGAEGFDRAVSIVSDGLRIIETRLDGCTPMKMRSIIENPDSLDSLAAYNGDGYHLTMRANHALVDLAAKGRNAPPINATLTADDNNALRSVFISFVMDDQVMGLVRSATAGGAPVDFDSLNINLCQLGRTVMLKLDSLPDATKGRLWATATSGDAARFMSMGGLQGLQGMQGMQGMPAFTPGGSISGALRLDSGASSEDADTRAAMRDLEALDSISPGGMHGLFP